MITDIVLICVLLTFVIATWRKLYDERREALLCWGSEGECAANIAKCTHCVFTAWRNHSFTHWSDGAEASRITAWGNRTGWWIWRDMGGRDVPSSIIRAVKSTIITQSPHLSACGCVVHTVRSTAMCLSLHAGPQMPSSGTLPFYWLMRVHVV